MPNLAANPVFLVYGIAGLAAIAMLLLGFGIYAAVTRRTIDGRNPTGWVPRQKITVEEAVRAYTANAAYASFDEERKGILSKGRLADFVMLERNIFEIAPDEIGAVRVRMTVVGGRLVFDRTH